MKNIKLLFVMMMFSGVLFAQKTITVDKLPTTVEEFISFRDNIASTPEGGAAAFVVALYTYSENPTLGLQMMIVQSDKNLLSASESGYKGFNFGSSNMFLIKQIDQKKYIPKSYFKGTSPAKGYALPAAPFKIICSTNQFSKSDDGKMKIFVECSGADTPRPITLVKNDKGMWKAWEFSSLMVGVRPPASTEKSGPSNGDF